MHPDGSPRVDQPPFQGPDARTSDPTPIGGEVQPADSGFFQWATPRLREVLSSLLPTRSGDASGEAWLKDTTKRMRSALLNYGLQAKVLDERLTPNAALIRFQGSDRLKVADVESKRSQLLTTHELKVIRISAEPGSVVIMVARPEREIVSLVDVLRDRMVDNKDQHMNQSLVVGTRESEWRNSLPFTRKAAFPTHSDCWNYRQWQIGFNPESDTGYWDDEFC